MKVGLSGQPSHLQRSQRGLYAVTADRQTGAAQQAREVHHLGRQLTALKL